MIEAGPIKDLIAEMQKHPQAPIDTTHEFADGVYIRRVVVPAGVFAVGARHKTAVFNVVLKGRVFIYDGKDNPLKEIVGPCAFVSPPGTQKVGFFMEETEWINTIPTDETDVKVIERDILFPENQEVLA